MFGLSKLATRIAIGLIALVLLLGVLQVRSCINARQQAAQSKVDRGQAGAARESAADAVNTMGDVSRNDMSTADLDRRNRKEIEDAEGADQRVSGPATAAGRNSLCRRAAYRNRPECRVQQPDPR